MKKVFVSYRHTSKEFDEDIKQFVDWLRHCELDPIVDFVDWHASDVTWWDWAMKHMEDADWILAVFNQGYKESWRRTDWTESETGKGCGIEAQFIKGSLAQHPGRQGKTKFVYLDRRDSVYIPHELRLFRSFDCSDGADKHRLIEVLKNPPDAANPAKVSPQPPPAWVTFPKKTADADDNRYARKLLDPVQKLRVHTRLEATRKVRQKIVNIMGNLTERFGATSSWLFLKEKDAASVDIWIKPSDQISPEYSHNTGARAVTREASASGKGIVSYVAATQRPYLSNDVTNNPRYHKGVESSASELAVPIFCVDIEGVERLIGVFNLESNQRDAFLEAHRGELMAAATEFAPEILIHHYLLQHPNAFGWHPETAGWTLERLLEDFCSAVSASEEDALPAEQNENGTKLTMPSCTVWYLDREEERLYVRATSRFDYEYVNRRGLGNNSFTWKVAHLEAGFVGSGEPRELPDFQRRQKSRNMGMVLAYAAPIHRATSVGPSSSVGSLNLYFFGEELKEAGVTIADLKSRFPVWVVPELARQLGELIDGTQTLRIEVAAAYLRYRLHEHALPGLTDFETVKEVILSCLDADGCSIFVREPSMIEGNRGTLHCVATTGLRRFDGTSVDLKDIYYNLDDPAEQGIAAYLAKQSNQNLRCRSIVDLRARHSTLALDAVNKYRETYSHTDTEHRPFIGISVDDPLALQKPPTGIVRVLRRSGSKPFVHTDELLMRRIIRDCHFIFYRWRESRCAREEQEQPAIRGARFPFLVRVVGNVIAQPKLEAIGHLGTEFVPGAVWNRRQVDAALLDLINLFRNPNRQKKTQGGLIANLRLTQPRNGDEIRKTRVFAIHAPLSSDPPPEVYLADHENATIGIGLKTIEERHATTFSRTCAYFRPILEESKVVVSGACMPMRLLSERGSVWGVLSIDCDDLKFEDWTKQHLLVLALAAKKLDFIGRDNRLRDEEVYRCEDWHEAVEQFILSLRKAARLQACNMVGDKGWQFFNLPGDQMSALNIASADMKDFPDKEIATWSTRGAFRIPLYFGPFDTKLTLIGCFCSKPPPFAEEWMLRRIVEISQLWNRFTNSRVGTGVTPLFGLSFTERPARDGIRIWDESIEIASDVLGRGPVPFPAQAEGSTTGS